ncbi:hypothetical protein [Methylobacterium radiotolerans]|uniref:hypothetical protein n=1 Tax=Methylobacterium radiotolerans TaxID=31998 RepID=UPI000D5EECE7|nr:MULTISPECIES: hypothetical protein [Methylobacterium]MDE3750123.1 hypothetical protein [Methylobacterium radiotolerans]PVY95775.1 hypothetical protein C7388_1239 [Methylobacterium organophilum]
MRRRLLRPAGRDLAVTGFRLEEAILTPFQAEIALASPDPGLDLTALLGAELEAVPAGQAAGLPISGEHGLRDGGEAV